MSSVNNAGRISKRSFLVSTSVLFGAVLLSLIIRLYIRLYHQKQFSVDDGFIIFGVALLTAAMGMLYYFVDEMFLAEALLLQDTRVALSFDVIQDSLDFEKWAAVSLIITWVAVNSVKLSFLSLFRKLVDRLRPMIIYWRFVLAYTICVGLYGISAYIAPCPTFHSFKAFLAIPIRLIYKLQIKLTQKIALSFSLCLSVAMIAVTLTRASGIVNNDHIDATWETYWQYLSAEVGLLMATATAFRSFFVARSRRRAEPGSKSSWYQTVLQRLRSVLRSTRTASRKHRDPLHSSEDPSARNVESMSLPQIPRPTMTGIRTFISGSGKKNWTRSQMMASHGEEDGSRILQSTTIDVEYP